ncbi:hypothetical protein HanIR_Chr03g0147911 [Helianthus annuus]|nr:hypothetical protein HanIR_Chr03g0147911 [Helianthus annuus]
MLRCLKLIRTLYFLEDGRKCAMMLGYLRMICLCLKPESDDDSVVEISKADYVDNAFKDIYEDGEVVSVGEGTTFTQNLPTNAECTSKRRMSSRLKKTQDVKKKGKVTSERKEVFKNRTKGNAALPVDTSDHTGCSSSVHKVKVYTCQLISICYINCFFFCVHILIIHLIHMYMFTFSSRGRELPTCRKSLTVEIRLQRLQKNILDILLTLSFFHFDRKGDYMLGPKA